jgi:hypothetical protein
MTPDIPASGAVALHESIGTGAASHGPQSDLARRFEALLERPEVQSYVAPPAAPQVQAPDNALLKQASQVSQRVHGEMEKPLEIPEDASDLDKLQLVMNHNQSVLRVSLEFQYTTKVAELGTRNLQTLYQMQG